MAYFLGTVLNNSKEGDPTFDFTDKEKQDVRLTGLPVRIEHLDNMHVGNIECDWLDKRSGDKWVLGKLNLDSFKSRYAWNATNNSKLYRGLSLQHHVYKGSDGRRVKVPIEVSVCREGRRPGTKIRRTGAVIPRIPKTTKREYIHVASQHNKSMSEAQNTTPAVTTAPTAQTSETPSSSTTSAAPVIPDMNTVMQALVDSEKDKAEAENQMKAMQEKLAAVEKELQDRIAAEKQGEVDERLKMADALSQTWEQSLGNDFTPEHKEAIRHLASEFPRETKAMFEVACLASKRFAAVEKSRADSEQAALEQKVVNVITRKREREQPRLEQVHVASTKAAKKSVFDAPATNSRGGVVTNNEGLFNAIRRLGKTSARNSMDQISDYQQSLLNTRL